MKILAGSCLSFVALLLISASYCGATSIPVRVRSGVGTPPPAISLNIDSGPFVVPGGNGIEEFHADDFSAASDQDTGICDCNIIEVVIPPLPPGTVIDFQGLMAGTGVTDISNVYINDFATFFLSVLSPDLFVGEIYYSPNSSTPQTVTQAMIDGCANSVNPTSVVGGFEITTASCALDGATYFAPDSPAHFDNSVVLEFDNQTAYSTSVTFPTAEPDALLLAGIGILGLMCVKFLRM
jgi:hypothetical protein